MALAPDELTRRYQDLVKRAAELSLRRPSLKTS